MNEPEQAENVETSFANGQNEAEPEQSCIFSVKYHELSSFQVEFGTILDYDQFGSTSSDVGLCDDCKVSKGGTHKRASWRFSLSHDTLVICISILVL